MSIIFFQPTIVLKLVQVATCSLSTIYYILLTVIHIGCALHVFKIGVCTSVRERHFPIITPFTVLCALQYQVRVHIIPSMGPTKE